jgi:DNA-binding NarL/FixJ family response regulator
MIASPTLRILIADDHDLVRQGMRALLQRRKGWTVCGLASTGREAVAQAGELKPDIVIMDMAMPELNGLDAAIQIKRDLPATEILMFTAHESDEVVRDAFAAGVKSFMFKSEAWENLVQAIESLAEHKPFLTQRVSDILFSTTLNRLEAKPDGTQPGQRLTARERETVQLLAEGKTNKEIADMLGISVRTSEHHRAAILRKLNLQSVAALVRYAIRNKLIDA